jgi:predicted unusual protein kinase regulating ubiquinone biosynthesis (AarF/ABC1/UbiB family)
MEFIEGVTLFDVDDKYKTVACRLAFTIGFTMSFFGKFNHTDLHPGNLLVITKGDKVKLGVIDFGMNVIESDRLKEFSHGCLKYVIKSQDDPTHKPDILRYCAVMTDPPVDVDTLTPEQYDKVNQAMCYIVSSASDGDLTERKIHTAVSEFRKALKSDTLLLSMDMVKYAMGFSMLQSSTRLLINDDKEMGVQLKLAIRDVMSY